MALATLALEPKAAREPHWHPNAAELSYCMEGSARITIVEPGGTPVAMDVGKGDMVFVPAGYLHAIESTSGGETRFLICFSHDRYEDLNLSTSLANMPPHVLGASFGVAAETFGWVEPTSEASFIAKQAEAPSSAKPPLSPYRYQLESLDPQVENEAGLLRFARADDWPILDGLSMYSLWFSGMAVREPHWHANCAELNYLLNGRVRVTIVSPGGDVDTFELGPGEVSYIPPAYFHHIESLVDEEVQMCVFFNHELPADNGIAAALSAYSPELLAAVYGRPAESFASLPRFDEDVLLAPAPAPATT
jgi:oxalate decarboxylase